MKIVDRLGLIKLTLDQMIADIDELRESVAEGYTKGDLLTVQRHLSEARQVLERLLTTYYDLNKELEGDEDEEPQGKNFK